MSAKICVSVFSPDTAGLLGRVKEAERLSADLIEVRLDKLRSHRGLSNVARSVEKPLIATNRSGSEEGSFNGSETDRMKQLVSAADEGFSYVDLEVTALNVSETIDLLREKGTRIILSHHDFARTPSILELESINSQLQRHDPDFCKIVTTAKSPSDNLAILGLLDKNRGSKPPIVSFAMGEPGIWSRVTAPFYGAAFTYASLERGLETAPGQLAVSDLRRIYQTLGLE